jgi:hypothetical protein
MAKEQVIIKEAPLSNNCPECFNQDMTLRFLQSHLRTKLYHRTTSEVQETLECNTCHTRIYPVQWTDDIERGVDFYRKIVEPKRASIRFTSLFYILVILGIAGIGALVYLYLQGAFTIA